jgi:kynurenine formamidase
MDGRWIWLSFPLDVHGPRPPAIPAPSLKPLMTIAKDGAAVQTLRLASHTGTHLDAPLHVAENGLAVGDFQPDEFVFTRPVVVDLASPERAVVMPAQLEPHRARLRGADIALFRFGYGPLRRETRRGIAISARASGLKPDDGCGGGCRRFVPWVWMSPPPPASRTSTGRWPATPSCSREPAVGF